MKRGFKKFGAFLLTAVMALAMNSTVFAADFTDGEVGGYTAPDTQNLDEKTINIQKELKVFNPDETTIYAPAISYQYAIAAATGSELVLVTDADTDHASQLPTSATAKGGITANLSTKVNGTATDTIAWTNAETVTAAADGAINIKNLTVDFENVVFTAPGVYRYKITETANAYTTNGVIDGDITNVRYLDVYVMRSANFDVTHDGTAGHEFVADDWRIYGYVCISPESVTNNAGGTTAVTPSTVKTNGFVSVDDPDNDPTTDDDVTADEYHTYNLTIGKTLTGDATMSSHKFPFDVAWTDGGATGSFQFGVIASANNTAVTADNSQLKKVGGADAVTTLNKDGTPSIANGGTIKYVGIPQAATATITETNDVAGTTYTTTATETIGAGSAAAVVFDTSSQAALSGDKKTATVDANGTAVYVEASPATADSNYAVQFTNALAIISPTGFIVRFAPYMLVLMGGIFLIVLGVVLYKRTNREEA